MSFIEQDLVYGELKYERRIISFFDVLGWRAEIAAAGADPRKVARLASVPRLMSQRVLRGVPGVEGSRISSFSDNVIISVPYKPEYILLSAEGLAAVQLGLALAGFWMRGAITIGNLYHDDDIVFGPGLVRAYELESKKAVVPRALLDPEVAELNSLTADFLSREDGLNFTDPFNAPFIERKNAAPVNTEMLDRFNEMTGLQLPTGPIAFQRNLFSSRFFSELNALWNRPIATRCAKSSHGWLIECALGSLASRGSCTDPRLSARAQRCATSRDLTMRPGTR